MSLDQLIDLCREIDFMQEGELKQLELRIAIRRESLKKIEPVTGTGS